MKILKFNEYPSSFTSNYTNKYGYDNWEFFIKDLLKFDFSFKYGLGLKFNDKYIKLTNPTDKIDVDKIFDNIWFHIKTLNYLDLENHPGFEKDTKELLEFIKNISENNYI
jgi:hypothetical protein